MYTHTAAGMCALVGGGAELYIICMQQSIYVMGIAMNQDEI